MTDTPTSAPSAPAAPAPVDPAPINPTTPHEARVRIDALTSNKEWGKRWLEGGIAEHKEYQRLSALADQADEVKDAIAGTTPEPNLIETVSPGQFNSRDLASTVEMFRDSGLTDDVIHQAMRGSEVSEVSRAEFLAAKAMKSARLGDKAWCERWLAGGWNEGREMLLINTIVSSFQER